jgi:hypothetical protein
MDRKGWIIVTHLHVILMGVNWLLHAGKPEGWSQAERIAEQAKQQEQPKLQKGSRGGRKTRTDAARQQLPARPVASRQCRTLRRKSTR